MLDEVNADGNACQSQDGNGVPRKGVCKATTPPQANTMYKHDVYNKVFRRWKGGDEPMISRHCGNWIPGSEIGSQIVQDIGRAYR